MINLRNPLFTTLLRAVALWAALGAGATAALAADRPELRSTLFSAADRALASANENRASLLAPDSYSSGADSYQRAQSIFASGGDIASIQRYLARAQSDFAKAALAAHTAAQTFTAALSARADADNAEAERYAADGWRDAEAALTDAASRLERGRGKSAKTRADQAENLYRDAELAAIKANYLNETRSLLDTADELKAERFAPISYQRARDLLEQAEKALNENRYDTDRPRNLAQLAEHNAHHAIYVARLERRIRDGDTTLEKVLLEWEADIDGLADHLDVPVYFDGGHQQAIKHITDAVESLKADMDFLQQGVADRDAEIASLKVEVGGKSESLARVNETLARRERERTRLKQVESLFSPDEAIVLRQSDSVILRLIGLNFASGSARLDAGHEPILNNVQQALAAFPEANIVVEGHTDSFGSDQSNQTLSQARADAVMQYLLNHAPLSPAHIQALGYGESRPVANNETPEGRKRNRRIDIVIYPKW